MITRRFALFRIATGSAVAAATAMTSAVPTQNAGIAESKKHFETPLEYLLAMQSIGWTPRAMFHHLEGGGVHCMGVNESAPSKELVMETWAKFHAIQMRCPIQRAADLPQGDWWREVWRFLYDRGLREDVTPKRITEAQFDGGEA